MVGWLGDVGVFGPNVASSDESSCIRVAPETLGNVNPGETKAGSLGKSTDCLFLTTANPIPTFARGTAVVQQLLLRIYKTFGSHRRVSVIFKDSSSQSMAIYPSW